MSQRNDWQMMRGGDKGAFDRLYDLYFDSLFAYGKQYVADDSVVQDSIQDLFVHLWLTREKLPVVISVKGYLYKSLRNRIFNALKREKLFREKTSREWQSEEVAVALSHETFMISGEEDFEKKASLRRAFGELTNHQREALFLRYYENLDYEEIATTLALKDVKYARTLIYRSLESLKNWLRKT